MMNEPFEHTVARLAGQFVTLLRENDQFRADVALITQVVWEAIGLPARPQSSETESLQTHLFPEMAERREETPKVLESIETPEERSIREAARVELTDALARLLRGGLGADAASEGVAQREGVYTSSGDRREAGPAAQSQDDFDDARLRRVEGCLRVKSEASYWALERMNLLASGVEFETEIKPRDRAMHQKANEFPDCYLWMAGAFTPSPETVAEWEQLAGCFEALADAVASVRECLRQTDNDSEYLEQALDLAAEGQSALRIAVESVGQGYDPHQVEFFRFLKGITAERQIFIERYMRLTDPADPAAWQSLQERIGMLGKDRVRREDLIKERKKWMSKIRYHAQKILQAEGDGATKDWETLFNTTEDLVASGVQYSNRELRDLILPIVEKLPEIPKNHPNVELVLREIDRYLSFSPTASSGDAPSANAPEVDEARKLLEGATIAIIGGEPRPPQKAAIEAKLGLKELVWVPSVHHQSIEEFRSIIFRDEIALVLLAIRWSSHSFGEVKDFCDEAGKPLVRLPAGYNVNQVAKQILEQAGARLGSAAEVPVEATAE